MAISIEESFMLSLPPIEQLIDGIAAALIVCSVLRWTPIPRELLIALAVGIILNLLVPDHKLTNASGQDFSAQGLARELTGHPYFNLGIAIVTTVALFLASRRQ
jgi:hypothetical protein